MNKYLSKKANSIVPYVPGEQMNDKEIIKLNTNENPYGASEKVFEAIKNNLNNSLKKYPTPDATDFRKAVAKVHNVDVGNVFCGNGSDDVLACVFQAFFDKTRPLYMPDITYSFYPVWANLFDIPIERIPLEDDFSIDVKKYSGVGNVIIPNPNAPTGMLLSLDEIELILKNNIDHVVVIDEAYIDFGGESAVALNYPNLLVVKTLSKGQSLAGLRAGYAIGDKDLIDGLFRIKDSYNSYPINTLTCAASKAAIEDNVYYDMINAKIIKTREFAAEELKKIGFTVLKSYANFVFVTHEEISAKEIYRRLKQNKILVRWFDADRIRNFLRISIGTDEDMQQLINCIKREFNL